VKLFTVGYEQATQPAVVAALRDAGVEVLADIRYLTLSRPVALPHEGEGWVGVCGADGLDARLRRAPPPLDPLPAGEGR